MIYNKFNKNGISISCKIDTIRFINSCQTFNFPYKLTIHEKINYKSMMFENILID